MSSFSITTPETTVNLRPTTVKAGEKATGSATYSVTNRAGMTVHTRLRIEPTAGADASWFKVRGDEERDIAPGATESYSVDLSVPPGTGRHSFQGIAVNLGDPDNDFEAGSAVAFELPAVKENGGKFPWWIVALAAGLVIVVGGAIAAFILLRNGPTYDLAVDSVRLDPSEFTPGPKSSIAATAVLGNRAVEGDEIPGGYELEFVLSGDERAPVTAATESDAFAEDGLLGNGKVSATPPLAAAASAEVGPVRLDLPIVEAGAYFVCAVADPAGAVGEKDAANNFACAPLRIVDQPVVANVCADTVQGNIAWDFKGTKTWAADNLERLCAGAEDSREPGTCFGLVLFHDKALLVERMMKWTNESALDLCRGSQDAGKTIECFNEVVRRAGPAKDGNAARKILESAMFQCDPKRIFN